MWAKEWLRTRYEQAGGVAGRSGGGNVGSTYSWGSPDLKGLKRRR